MLSFLASLLLPLVLLGQLVALTLLWRRYRMPGAGDWLLATVLICLCTAGQAVEESGWHPVPLVAAVNALGFLGAVTELRAARRLTGQPLPDRRSFRLLLGVGLVWAVVAALPAGYHGWLRMAGIACLGVSEAAIALSLYRLSRDGGTAGGYLAAAGYGLQVLMMPTYPFGYALPWLRTVGMVNAAFCFILIGWGLLLFVLERHQGQLVQDADGLAAAASGLAARAAGLEQRAAMQEARLAEQQAQADMGLLASDLAAALQDALGVVRQSAARLGSGPGPGEQDLLAGRIERTWQDLTLVAAGIVTTAGHPHPVREPLDLRLLLERLLADYVPAGVAVRKAWPAAQVRVGTDATLLAVALHQVIRRLCPPGMAEGRLSVLVTDTAGVTVRLQQAAPVADGGAAAAGIGWKLARLAVQRLGGRIETGLSGTGLDVVLHLPGGDHPGPADGPAGSPRPQPTGS